jgi:hypothetical protein
MKTSSNILPYFPYFGNRTITSFNNLKRRIIILLLFVLNSCEVLKDNSSIKPTNDFSADKIDVDLVFVNQDIRLKGKNFKSNEQNIKISFGNVDVTGIKVFSDSMLIFQVPQNAISGSFKIMNKDNEKEILNQNITVYELENKQILNLPFIYEWSSIFKSGVTIKNNNKPLFIISPSLMTRFVDGLENGGALDKQMRFDNENLLKYNQLILGENFSQNIEEWEKVNFTINKNLVVNYNVDPKYLMERNSNRLLLQTVQLKNNKFVYYFRDELIEYDIVLKKITRRLNIGSLGNPTYIFEFNNKLFIFEETKIRVVNLNDLSIQIVNKFPFQRIIEGSSTTYPVTSFAILKNSIFYTKHGKLFEFNLDSFEIKEHIELGSNVIIGTFENHILHRPTSGNIDSFEYVSIYDLDRNKHQGNVKIKPGDVLSSNFYFINKCARLGYSDSFQAHVDCQETNLFEIVVKKK